MAEDASERVRRAREALAEVKADSLAKGNRPARIAPNNQKLAAPPDSPRGAGGRRGRRDDPQSLTSAIDGLISLDPAPGRLLEIRDAFTALPVKQRAVAVLRIYLGLSEEETAAA